MTQSDKELQSDFGEQDEAMAPLDERMKQAGNRKGQEEPGEK